MMTNLIRKAVPLLLFAPVAILAGCYTQVGGVRSDRDYTPDEQSYNNEEYVDSTEAGNQYAYEDYDGYGNSRYPYAFNYYYPPYYDPWFYGPRMAFGYYYDPIWWDYSPGYYGLYGSYYRPAYWWAYGGSSHFAGGTELRGHGTRRTIGNIRASGSTRGTESGFTPAGRGSTMTLPSGARLGSGAARKPASPVATPRTSTGRPAGSGVDRTGKGRTGSREGTSTRPSRPQSRPSGGGSRGGGARSYTPPPPPPPSTSSTPSGGSGGGSRGGSSGGSSGGGNSSGGGSRGGNRR